jgi:hypothetical protein
MKQERTRQKMNAKPDAVTKKVLRDLEKVVTQIKAEFPAPAKK